MSRCVARPYFNLAFVFIVSLLTACARPQYLATPATTALEKAGEEKACFANSELCLDIFWEKRPTETEYGSFIFTISNSSGLLGDVAVAGPDVVLWMPSMGHGSAKVKVEKQATGLYRASNVFFPMKGDWEIRFKSGDDQATYVLFLQ